VAGRGAAAAPGVLEVTAARTPATVRAAVVTARAGRLSRTVISHLVSRD
jgi:hypothetical protein